MDVGTAQMDGNLQLAVALLLLNHCLMCCSHCLWGLCVLSLFRNALLTCSILSSFAVILTGKRKLVVLLLLSPWCLVTVIVLWLFLVVPWVGMQCVFVVFPDQTHLLLGLKARLSAVHIALPDVNVLV